MATSGIFGEVTAKRTHSQAFTTSAGIAWLAGNPIVGSVIAGATSAEQVVQNAAAGGITLSAADRAEIEVSAPGPVQGLTACPSTRNQS